ncbi:MAG: hypothetical protein Ct9H300mP15_26770 [Gemmatimonadota bacterium]|nr:MAG: hypothetical protein Ct9H300mP15_26770 [Gemmatimonadota bacterium]
MLTKDEGGRHTPSSMGTGHSLFPYTDVTGATELPEGVEMVMPGDNVQMEVELLHRLRWILNFGSRSVRGAYCGAGVVTEIIQ